MEKKVILITGATQGIGKITASALAKQGHHIIIHGRNAAKLQEVANEIISESANKNVETIVADLFSVSDTKRMAEEFKTRFDHLDVLINNAGAILNKNREVTKEGLEKTMALNLFAPYILMNSLIDHLAKSKSGRIINISSAMHRRGGTPMLDDIQAKNKYSSTSQYGLSKLYLIWISRHMVKIIKEMGIKNVTVNVSHPGAVATNFGLDSDKGFLINSIFKLAGAISRLMRADIADGAKTGIYLATSPEVENVTSEFYDNKMKIEKPDDKFYTLRNEQIVWDYCKQITEK